MAGNCCNTNKKYDGDPLKQRINFEPINGAGQAYKGGGYVEPDDISPEKLKEIHKEVNREGETKEDKAKRIVMELLIK